MCRLIVLSTAKVLSIIICQCSRLVRGATLESEGIAGSIPDGGIIFLFWNFRLVPIAHNSAKPLRMHFSMTFQSNGSRYIFSGKEYGGGIL